MFAVKSPMKYRMITASSTEKSAMPHCPVASRGGRESHQTHPPPPDDVRRQESNEIQNDHGQQHGEKRDAPLHRGIVELGFAPNPDVRPPVRWQIANPVTAQHAVDN